MLFLHCSGYQLIFKASCSEYTSIMVHMQAFCWSPYGFIVLLSTLGCSQKQYGNHHFCISILMLRNISVAVFIAVWAIWCLTQKKHHANIQEISQSTNSYTHIMAQHRQISPPKPKWIVLLLENVIFFTHLKLTKSILALSSSEINFKDMLTGNCIVIHHV